MERIKPSLQERVEYSSDERHLRCFSERPEIKKLKLEEKFSRIHERDFSHGNFISYLMISLVKIFRWKSFKFLGKCICKFFLIYSLFRSAFYKKFVFS